ncbi:hypothetical protein [Vreelandella glaciei]|uniref:hypothetical protein n=1 Tax=Vreelandella glaciei TaxID=186761 RepID=UPI003001E17D
MQLLVTGRRYIACQEDVLDTTHYVSASNEVIPKQALQLEINTEGLSVIITGVPAGLTVETKGLTTLTDNEPLIIHYDVPGNYEITLRGHVEYLDQMLEVTLGNP